MRLRKLIRLILLAAPLAAAGQQAPLPPGAQPPDVQAPAAQANETPETPGLKQRAIDPALAAVEDQIDARQYDAARPELLRYLEQHPHDARGVFDQGYIEDATGQLPAAEADYRRAISLEPRQFEAHATLGLLLAHANGKADEARSELKTAGGLEPASHDAAAKAQVWRALAQLQVDTDAGAARASLLEALRLEPDANRVPDLLLTARIAEANDDAETAETAYRRVLAQQPGSPEANGGLAHLLVQQKEPAKAEALLRRALVEKPGDPGLSAQLASVLGREGKLQEAVPVLEKLHEEQPADAAITRMLGDLYLEAGSPEKAQPLIEHALAATPNDPALLSDEGQCLILGKRFAEAVPVLERATASDPRDVDAFNGLAFAYSQLHQDAMTLKTLEARSKISGETPPTLFLWATAYDSLHQSHSAAEYYHRFLDEAHGRFPDEEWQARHRLIALGKMP